MVLQENKLVTLVLVGLFGFISLLPPANAASLWENHGSDKLSQYSDKVAVAEGDLVKISISESASATTDSTREREKSMEVGGSANEGSENSTIANSLVSWIPFFGAAFSGGSNYESERNSDLSGSLNTTISVRVKDIDEQGVMRLRGSRKIKIGDEVKTITIEGFARRRDVRPDNTIPSDRIADAEIYYEGQLGLRNGEPSGLIGSTWVFIKNVLFW